MWSKFNLIALLVLALQAPDRATIEGVVTKVGTTEPVPRASIVVTRIQGQLSDVKTVVADASGRFVVTNLAPGSHRVFASKDGYVRTEYGQRSAPRPGTVVDLGAGETRRGITISMTPTGVISGRILDPDGKPLRSAFVRVSRVAYDSGTRELRMVQRLQTNDLGEFRFFELEPGPYYLMALPKDANVIDGDNYLIRSTSPPDFLGGEPDVRLTAQQALDQGALSAAAFKEDVFETTYYPGTKDQAAALPIDLKPGGTFSGVELRILKSSWVHVRGRVIDGETGKPRSATVGLALPFYGTDQRNINGRVTDGAFDLRAPAGSYMLSAQASRTTPNGPYYSAFMPLVVGDRDIDNLTLTLLPSFSVSGKMRIDGRPPGGNNPALQRALINLRSNVAGGVQVRPAADGNFTMIYVSRVTYRFALVLLPDNYYIKSARLGSQDVTDGTITFDGPPNDSLDIVLSPTTASITATVVDEAQQPQQGMTVVLVPNTARRTRRDLFQTAVSDASGRVNLTGIAPGDYKVFAWENVIEDSWEDPEILRMYDSRGQAIRLNDTSKETLTLRVIR